MGPLYKHSKSDAITLLQSFKWHKFTVTEILFLSFLVLYKCTFSLKIQQLDVYKGAYNYCLPFTVLKKSQNFCSRIFMELDINGDGELTCEEFVKGCMQDESLVRVLQSGGLNPEEADQDD